ncbi:MAG: sodium-dependent transporter [Desulfobia sp.]
MVQKKSRPVWGSKLGFLLAAIGSALGLGNIWRFSYTAFEHGGGAFLLPYFIALVIAGIPLLILEYVLGHRGKGSSPLAFARVSRNMEWVGWWMPIIALFGIMLYYSVVMGWCLNYFFFSLNLSWGPDPQDFFFNSFLQLTDSPLDLGGIRVPIISATFFIWFTCWVICYREVNYGIEKACTFFMPLLFVLTIILVGWTVNLEGAGSAIKNFYLKPDWDKINIIKNFSDPAVWNVWVTAFGQIFFTLSLGFGIMITYASYLPRKTDLVGSALWISIVNCIYSFIAGFIVFGIVGFMSASKGIPFDQVIKGGPQLAFVVYPEAIRQLPFGRELFGAIFFLILLIAGLSSGISLVEAFTCSLMDKFSWPRKKVVSALCLLGFAGSIVFTTRGGLLILDIVDHFVTNYGLVIGGIMECFLVGWLLKVQNAKAHIEEAGGRKVPFFWDICIRFVTPALLLLLVGKSLTGELASPYGGYSTDAIILYGVDWIMLTVVVAIVFTFYPWRPEKLRRHHRLSDDQILT